MLRTEISRLGGLFMASFEHLVLTRFNVRLSEGDPDPRGLSREWLESRLKLFASYCYPSLRHQGKQNFRWMVLFDSRTPDWFRERISPYCEWPPFTPLYVDFALDEDAGSPQALQEALLPYIGTGCTHLITTRIDNDDAISMDYIEQVQDCFAEQEQEAVVFPFGYQLHNGRLYLEYSRGNHFISLIARLRAGTCPTVYVKPHNQMYEEVPVRQVWKRPNWVEVVHGANLANRLQNGLPLSTEGFRARFATDKMAVSDVNHVRLRGAQLWFLCVGAPMYLCTKAFNRLKHHGLGRP